MTPGWIRTLKQDEVWSLTGVVITGALVLNPCSHRRTLGNNGPGDGWARGVCPLNRPINLDETLAAPSQITPPPPLFYHMLPPPQHTHFEMEKSCYNSCGRFLATCPAEWRNIYTMGCGDDSAQLARSKGWRLVSSQVQIKHTCVHIHARIRREALHACTVVGFRRS